MRRGQQPGQHSADAESQQLVSTLRDIIQFLGGVYSEASGQCAAAQRVVADLKRSLAYLNSRAETSTHAESPLCASTAQLNASTQSPWLTPTTPSGAPAHSTTSAPQTPAQVINSSPSVTPLTRVSSSGAPVSAKSPTSATSHALPPSRQHQPQSQSQMQRRGGMAASGMPSALSGPRTPTTPMARSMSVGRAPPHRPRAASPAASGGAPLLATSQKTPVSAGLMKTRQQQLQASPELHQSPGQQQQQQQQVRQTINSTQAQQQQQQQQQGLVQAMSNTPAHQQQQQQERHAPGPLQMPVKWQRAVRQYNEVIQDAAQFATVSVLPAAAARAVSPAQQLPGAAPRGDVLTGNRAGHSSNIGQAAAAALHKLPMYPSHEDITGGLCRSVTVSSETYSAQLAAFYEASASGSSSGRGLVPAAARGSSSKGGAAAMQPGQDRGDAQVLFASVVAAQTWILNALRQLAEAGGSQGAAASSMGISAEGLYRLLQELRVARMQLAEVMDQQQQQQGSSQEAEVSSRGTAAVAAGAEGLSTALSSPPHGSRTASSQPQQGSVPVIGHELAQAALRWRNRFLRAMAAHAKQEALGPSEAASIPRPRSQSRSQGSRPEAAQVPTFSSASGSHFGGHAPAMARPLGIWLPNACWGPALAAGQEPPAAAAGSPGGQVAASPPAAAMAAAPWLLGLPCSLLLSPSSQQLLLPCPSLQHAVSHGRLQQQLQQCLMQLHLEGILAAPLLPRGPPPMLQQQQRQRPGRDSASSSSNPHFGWEEQQQYRDLERYIARCRLAHTFLAKGSWNRLCCVAEVQEGEHGQGLG